MAYIQISLTENDKKMLESAGQLVGLKTQRSYGWLVAIGQEN